MRCEESLITIKFIQYNYLVLSLSNYAHEIYTETGLTPRHQVMRIYGCVLWGSFMQQSQRENRTEQSCGGDGGPEQWIKAMEKFCAGSAGGLARCLLEFFYFFIIYYLIFQKYIPQNFFCRSGLLSPVQLAARTYRRMNRQFFLTWAVHFQKIITNLYELGWI